MQRLLRPQVIAALVLSLLSLTAIMSVLRNPQWLVAGGRLLGAVATPEVAVRDMLQVEANKLRNFRILDDQWIGPRRLVVFSYAVQRTGEPFHNEFGYALAEMRLGWSAIPGSLQADAPPPNLITYSSVEIDDATLVYGKALDPQIGMVEAVFRGTVEQALVQNGGFVVWERSGKPLIEIRALDVNGRVLQRAAQPEVCAPARWR